MKFLATIFFATTISLPSQSFADSKPRAVWGHSCYAYKDMNRSGVFDMGDKPYAGLRLEITRPDGTTTWRNSNVDGFANLNASLGNKEEHVPAPGVYQVRAIYPEGWQSLSSNDRQEIEFIRRDNAGGRLVPKETCRPIGIAPILGVKGKIRFPVNRSSDDYLASLISRSGQPSIALSIDRQGNYSSIAGQGNWRLQISTAAGETVYTRDISIEHGAVQISEIKLSADLEPELDVSYEQLDFDDLILDSLFEIPAGYGGLNWLNWISVHNRFYEGGGYVNNTVSSEFVAYNSSGVPGPIWSDKPFDFKGVYIGLAWPRGEEDEVIIKARRNDELVYEDRLNLTDNGPVWFDAGYENITFLEISHGNYERIVLDNLQYKLQ